MPHVGPSMPHVGPSMSWGPTTTMSSILIFISSMWATSEKCSAIAEPVALGQEGEGSGCGCPTSRPYIALKLVHLRKCLFA